MLLGLLVVVTAVGAGLFFGWWLRGSEGLGFGHDDSSRVSDAVDSLRHVTADVAANVDEHNTRMEQIYEGLVSSKAEDREAVLEAVSCLMQSNDQIRQQLSAAENQLEQQAELIESHAAAARTDALTSLANRRAFDDQIDECYTAFQEERTPVTVMLIDVDHFKVFNDTYGHQAGDDVLRGVARVMNRHVPQPYLVCRYGGEEFAVVFPGTEYSEVRELAEKVRAAIGEARFQVGDLQLQVCASAGLSELLPGEDVEAFVKRADDALYASKEAGRNCGHFHHGSGIVPLTRRTVKEAKPVAGKVDFERADFSAGISENEVFRLDLERRIDEKTTGGVPISVLLAAVDDFQKIESRHGDAAARAVSRAVSQFIKATMRDMDHVGHVEDGTFSLMLTGTQLSAAIEIAERLRSGIGRCRLPERILPDRTFTISVAVAEAQGTEHAEELLERVKASLTTATTYGRNCCYLHNGEQSELVSAGNMTLA